MLKFYEENNSVILGINNVFFDIISIGRGYVESMVYILKKKSYLNFSNQFFNCFMKYKK